MAGASTESRSAFPTVVVLPARVLNPGGHHRIFMDRGVAPRTRSGSHQVDARLFKATILIVRPTAAVKKISTHKFNIYSTFNQPDCFG